MISWCKSIIFQLVQLGLFLAICQQRRVFFLNWKKWNQSMCMCFFILMPGKTKKKQKAHEINPVSSSATGLPKIMVLLVVVKSLSCIWLLATPRTGAHLAPLSMGFPRQEFWSGLPFLSPGDLPDPGIEPTHPVLTGRFSDSSLLSQQGSPVFLFLEKKKEKEAWPERTYEPNLKSTSRHWEKTLEKLLREGPGCVFWGSICLHQHVICKEQNTISF